MSALDFMADAQRIKIGLHSNGCGHEILLTKEHYEACKETNRAWYCTVCGCQRVFVGKTTVDQLRGELAAAKQREETEKARRWEVEAALSKEQASKARLKKRIKNGVCPCCTRSFTNVQRHMATKHPDYKP